MTAADRPPAGAPAVERVDGMALRRFGRGPTLVLLHGGVGSWTHWSANLDGLAARFAVVTVDLPAYGDSDDIGRETTEEAYIARVGGLLDHLAAKAGPFGLVAFSFGAVIATALTATHAAAVKALTIVGPGGFGFPKGRNMTLEKLPRGGAENREVRAVAARNLGQWMLSAAPAPDDPVVDINLANIARTRFDSRRISLRESLVADLARTTCPVQAIWGGGDRLVVPSIDARVALVRAARPDIAVAIVPDAAHWVQYERPDAVNALIAEFHGAEGSSRSEA